MQTTEQEYYCIYILIKINEKVLNMKLEDKKIDVNETNHPNGS